MIEPMLMIRLENGRLAWLCPRCGNIVLAEMNNGYCCDNCLDQMLSKFSSRTKGEA